MRCFNRQPFNRCRDDDSHPWGISMEYGSPVTFTFSGVGQSPVILMLGGGEFYFYKVDNPADSRAFRIANKSGDAVSLKQFGMTSTQAMVNFGADGDFTLTVGVNGAGQTVSAISTISQGQIAVDSASGKHDVITPGNPSADIQLDVKPKAG